MSELAKKVCVPCQGGVPALKGTILDELKSQLHDDWKVVKEHHLRRELDFPDFQTALDFTNTIGAIAEEQAHHPNIHLTWGKVDIEIFTHKIDGLTESDFILAAKFDQATV